MLGSGKYEAISLIRSLRRRTRLRHRGINKILVNFHSHPGRIYRSSMINLFTRTSI